MKYNLGCGNDYRHGWLNVDRQAEVSPDLVWDLTQFPWPLDEDSADEAAIVNVLDEIPPAVLPRFMRELYRVCRSGAKVTVRARHPRHGDAALTPFGTGGLTANALRSYDLAVNEEWIAQGVSHTPSALYAGVDFEAVALNQQLDAAWLERWRSGRLGDAELAIAIEGQNNVVAASEVVFAARKPFLPGRSLRDAEALILVRMGGLGDVLMALAACHAIKSVVDRPVYLVTAPAYLDFARLCPYLNGAFADEPSLRAHVTKAGLERLKVVNLSPVRFGLSRLHEVDAFLQALTLSPSDSDKDLVVQLPDGALDRGVAARLAALPPHSKRIVLHAGISDPSRTWSADFWSDVARHCLALGHSVVTIGRSRSDDGKGVSRLADPRVLDLTDILDLRASLAVLRACDLLISADGGPIQLAGASDIAVIGIYSVVGGEHRLPYRSGSRTHRAAAVTPECPFSPCYRWMTDPDVQAEFIRADGLAPGDLNGLFSRWCVNADRYACTRETSIFDKVIRLIPVMLE